MTAGISRQVCVAEKRRICILSAIVISYAAFSGGVAEWLKAAVC